MTKILADECINAPTISLLRNAGLDVAEVKAFAQQGASDEEVIQLAIRTKRLLLTLNYRDFANRRRFPIGSNPGIIIIRVDPTDWKTVNAVVKRFLEAIGDWQLFERHLTIIRRDNYRIYTSRDSYIEHKF